MWRIRIIGVVALACLIPPQAVIAAGGDAAYAQWTLDGKSGTEEVPGVGFPAGTWSSDASTVRTPSGTSTFLNENTPFGKEFGGSRGENYLYFGAKSTQPSTTEVEFDAPTPAGRWGFTLGDVDADGVMVEAFAKDGTKLTAAQLGWKGAFNYCSVGPRPSACTSGPFTDQPTWDGAISTLQGNGPDTQGAAGWFMPTVPIVKLTLTFSVKQGIPVAQLWIASKWVDKGRSDIQIEKSASPKVVAPGGVITYTVTVTNKGTAPEEDAEYVDDLTDVIDDATYLGDAKADSGKVTYAAAKLGWDGVVEPGATHRVTFSVRVHRQSSGNRVIRNVVISEGARLNCDDGKGKGCAVVYRYNPRRGAYVQAGAGKRGKHVSFGFKKRDKVCRTANAGTLC
ncbi:DUF11 domain-containing protein [Nonomuraea soli]|uniref:Putative repeat protein (TIGR01451 family) n=1 Tax=Nonomuraea soli TaxID=1032476 RepID=A0A7W0HQT9_9ACTN|nr:DUF11 domain-containing protein [Nonomuraea soli]MBA2891926.1 putative repeat protein (TIGR01451 family) [Nonomuraea soli]